MEQQPPESPQQPPATESPMPEQPQPGYSPPMPPAYGAPPYGPPAGAPGYPPQPYGPPAGAPGYPPQPYGPPAGYPMPPASTPPGYYGTPPAGAPGYPPQPYGQQPPMTGAPYPYPYQQPPFPAPMPAPSTGPSRNLLWALVSLGVVVVVVLAVVGVTLIGHQNTPPNLTPAAVTSTAIAKSTYAASIPGPGCDTHGGAWKADFSTQTSCLADSLQITATNIANVIFSGTGTSSTFPQNYEVSVDVAPLNSLDAGLVVHQTASVEDGYEFGIDSHGGWSIYPPVAQALGGNVTAAAQYHLDIIVRGTSETLAINGNQVGQFTDTKYSGGDSIGLTAYAADSNAQANFKNFKFTTLP